MSGGRIVGGHHTAEEAYDHLADEYDEVYQTSKDLAENFWLIRHLEGDEYTAGFVLDVGCGTGLLLDLLPIPPNRYLGIDVSQSMLDRASAKHPAHSFERQSMYDLPKQIADSALYLFGSFSYALEPSRAVAAMAYALRPGGKFFVMLLSSRYPDRASYSVANAGFQVPIVTWTASEAEGLFTAHPDLTDVSVRGLSVVVDRLDWAPPSLVQAYYRLEAASVGRWLPDRAAYVVAEGRRR